MTADVTPPGCDIVTICHIDEWALKIKIFIIFLTEELINRKFLIVRTTTNVLFKPYFTINSAVQNRVFQPIEDSEIRIFLRIPK